MTETTSFGMQNKLESTSVNKTNSYSDNKPALPKRSPAPKQDTDMSVPIRNGEPKKYLNGNTSSSLTVSSAATENNMPPKTTTGNTFDEILYGFNCNEIENNNW